MMANIYDDAYNLEKAIRKSDEFQSLRTAFKKVMEDPGSRKMFEDYRNYQMELQLKQMQGEEISEEDMNKAQKRFEIIQQHTLIAELMKMEDRMNVVMEDISRIVSKPLDEVYQELANEA